MRAAAMRRIAFAAFALVSCAHAKTTETVEPTAPKDQPATEKAPRRPRGAPTGEKPRSSAIPLAPEAEGLLRPGAEQRIHDKLVAGGFTKDDANASTDAMLRRFQAAHDLPVTGVPDHETVRRLGFNPDDLFRKADP